MLLSWRIIILNSGMRLNFTCVKFSGSVKETYYKLIKVFGDEALSGAEVFWWHKESKNGRESATDES